jgi:YD repeat-containing protein
MSKTALLSAASVCAALVLTGPATAQLLGGGIGGSVGGVLQAPAGGLGAHGGVSGAAGAHGRLPADALVGRTRDAAGNLVTVTRDARGRLTATARDARGRVVSRGRVGADFLAGAQAGVATAIPAPAAPAVVAVVPAPPAAGIDVRRRDAVVASGVTVLRPSQVDVYMDRQIMDLRRELRGTDVEVVRRGDRIVLVLPSDITFAFDKSQIQPRFYPVLDSVARTLNAYPSTYVDVTGHADAVGTDEYNQRLSERRAAAVSAYLRQRGALPERLRAEGRGEQDPVASNASISGRAANRRVEINLTPVVG